MMIKKKLNFVISERCMTYHIIAYNYYDFFNFHYLYV